MAIALIGEAKPPHLESEMPPGGVPEHLTLLGELQDVLTESFIGAIITVPPLFRHLSAVFMAKLTSNVNFRHVLTDFMAGLAILKAFGHVFAFFMAKLAVYKAFRHVFALFMAKAMIFK